MHDIRPGEPEIPSPFQRPDHCPRCQALADCWVYVGSRMFLCADCYAELMQTGEPANLRPETLETLRREKR
jgi:hypothetical protein